MEKKKEKNNNNKNHMAMSELPEKKQAMWRWHFLAALHQLAELQSYYPHADDEPDI